MSFEFFSAGGIVLEEGAFYKEAGEIETAATYARKKNRVMEWLVAFSTPQILGAAFDPTKDSYPDHIDMAIIKHTDPDRWQQLEADALSDLAGNGFIAPFDAAGIGDMHVLPVPRSSEENLTSIHRAAA